MASVFGLQYVSRASVHIVLCTNCGPHIKGRIACKGLSLTSSLHSLQAYDDLYKGSAIHAKDHLLLAFYPHCRPMMTFVNGLQCMQRAISYLLCALIAGL